MRDPFEYHRDEFRTDKLHRSGRFDDRTSRMMRGRSVREKYALLWILAWAGAWRRVAETAQTFPIGLQKTSALLTEEQHIQTLLHLKSHRLVTLQPGGAPSPKWRRYETSFLLKALSFQLRLHVVQTLTPSTQPGYAEARSSSVAYPEDEGLGQRPGKRAPLQAWHSSTFLDRASLYSRRDGSCAV